MLIYIYIWISDWSTKPFFIILSVFVFGPIFPPKIAKTTVYSNSILHIYNNSTWNIIQFLPFCTRCAAQLSIRIPCLTREAGPHPQAASEY